MVAKWLSEKQLILPKIIEKNNLIHKIGIPEFKKEYLIKDEVIYVVQIMGKVRGKLSISPNASEEEIKEKALNIENVKKHLEGKEIIKIIIVPKKLISIVAK